MWRLFLWSTLVSLVLSCDNRLATSGDAVVSIGLHQLRFGDHCSVPGSSYGGCSGDDLTAQMQCFQELNLAFNLQFAVWMVRSVLAEPEVEVWEGSSPFEQPYGTYNVAAWLIERTEETGRILVEVTFHPAADCVAPYRCEARSTVSHMSWSPEMSTLATGPSFMRWTDHTVEANPGFAGNGLGMHTGCDLQTGVVFARTHMVAGGVSVPRYECRQNGELVDCSGVDLWPTGG